MLKAKQEHKSSSYLSSYTSRLLSRSITGAHKFLQASIFCQSAVHLNGSEQCCLDCIIETHFVSKNAGVDGTGTDHTIAQAHSDDIVWTLTNPYNSCRIELQSNLALVF